MMPWPSMQWPWVPMMQMQPIPVRRGGRLMMQPGGAFPVPESVPWRKLPPAVRGSYLRLTEGPPKPSVTLSVMNESQKSMIAPDLPDRPNV
ncbi:MAG TPA: hypothetical protein VIL07_00675 [Symbiobacteriaceae bacterium]